MKRFDGKTAVITGAASGMGKATALRLASEGAEIIIVDKDVIKSKELVAEFENRGEKACFVETDLTSYDSIQEMSREIAQITDKVHVLVNSAGIGQKSGLEEIKPENWEPITGINLRAPYYVTVALLPLMKNHEASVINISSDGGIKGRANAPIYDITKAGLISLSKTMAAGYVKYGIRVNAIAPGWVVTEFHYAKASDPEQKKLELESKDTDYCLMRRNAKPEEIAAAIAFLGSDDASYVTGTVLCVDGGRTGF